MQQTLGIVKGALLTAKQRHHLTRRINGKSVFEWVVRQMTECERLDGVVVLADDGPNGDLVRSLAPVDVPVHSSKTQDTMGLLLDVLNKFAAKSCLFIGTDWPFLDPVVLDQIVRAAEQENGCDYAAFQFTNDVFSAGRPYGLFPEWYRAASIMKAATVVTDTIHRQLPGSYFLDNQNKFVVELLPVPAGLDQENVRFSFDNEEDWDNLLEIHDALKLDVLDCRNLSRLFSTYLTRKNLLAKG